MSDIAVKLNDLTRKIQHYSSHIHRAVDRVISRGWFISGPELERFEKSFASYLNVPHCLGVANGTDAIELGLKAAGVQKGDVVATAANASMYTCTALQAIGATPHFMDVDLTTHVVTLQEVKRAIEAGVRAIVVTHLYGLAVPEIDQMAAVCREKNVILFEDCAQAHGARINGRCVGTFGDAASFSFYPTKNLGALGDGGAVVTASNETAHKLKSIRQYGWGSKYHVETPCGRNSRLDEMQAAILSELLPELDSANEKRRVIARQYSQNINHPNIEVPMILDEGYVAHLYVIKTSMRDSLRAYLQSLGIQTEIHYPVPDYRQAIYGKVYTGFHLANTDHLSTQILTLPCYPELTHSEVEHVINAIKGWAP